MSSNDDEAALAKLMEWLRARYPGISEDEIRQRVEDHLEFKKESVLNESPKNEEYQSRGTSREEEQENTTNASSSSTTDNTATEESRETTPRASANPETRDTVQSNIGQPHWLQGDLLSAIEASASYSPPNDKTSTESQRPPDWRWI
ncbi:hypothetical protein GQ53DRAFT_826964 [Thozetella sp. PMI_491]|nr:hypothetical protein GQ53DRAFT_826964 [Thozetella sp. PMI_491]